MGVDWTSPDSKLRVVHVLPVNRDSQVVLVTVEVRLFARAAMAVPILHADAAIGTVE
jgi:hypothetical protein